MTDCEKALKGVEACIKGDCRENACPYALENECRKSLERDALELLKAQELPPVKPERLEERTTEWLDKMTAKERLEEIAAICDDWDGYRTAKGLGWLINEIWAYALYPVKAQEPQKVKSIVGTAVSAIGDCPICGVQLHTAFIQGQIKTKFCYNCGQAVKWNG